MIMGIALRFMPQFADEFVSIYHAADQPRRSVPEQPETRGIRMLSSLTIPLFTSAFRRAETLAFAMDARCYHGAVGRTAPASLALHGNEMQWQQPADALPLAHLRS